MQVAKKLLASVTNTGSLKKSLSSAIPFGCDCVGLFVKMNLNVVCKFALDLTVCDCNVGVVVVIIIVRIIINIVVLCAISI